MDVSFKAVVLDAAGRVLLGRNPRDEWELLGGRADPGDPDPHATIARELAEEAGIAVRIGELVDIWYYDVPGAGRVAVASYLAHLDGDAELVTSDEHAQLRFFPVDEVAGLDMPAGYTRTILAAARLASGERPGAIEPLSGPGWGPLASAG